VDWQIYEEQIFEKFSSEFPTCKITKNLKIVGQFSKVERQIDIAIQGTIAGYNNLGIVECKCFNKKVDVKVIESFISFLEDIKANFGIMITNQGYSQAAKNWADVKKIKLDIISLDELEDYHFEWELCRICDPGEDRMPAVVDFYARDDESQRFQVGRCEWCNGINIKCWCGCITGIADTCYDEVIECEGGCGRKYIVEEIYCGSGLFEENIRLVEDDKSED